MKKLYVMKFEDNTYYAGHEQKSKYIHHARIYTSLSYINQAAKMMEKLTGLKYEIKEIYMSEQADIEMKLNNYEKLMQAFSENKILWQTETEIIEKGIYEVEAAIYNMKKEPIIKLSEDK